MYLAMQLVDVRDLRQVIREDGRLDLARTVDLVAPSRGRLGLRPCARAGAMIASASRDGTVRRWDPRTGRQRGEPSTGHDAEVVGVVFSPDGGMIASAGRDGSVRRWDARTGEQIGAPSTGHKAEVEGVAFSPDGG
jgi:WD40 repeat protein